MKVKDLMTVKVRTVSPEDKIDRVFFFMNFEQIRHIPVVEKGKVVGILSDRDLKKVFGSLKMNEINALNDNQQMVYTVKSRMVRTIMRRGVITIHPLAEAYEAAAVMAKRKIGALPVVKNEKLVGIISATDILRAFVKLTSSSDSLIKQTDKSPGLSSSRIFQKAKLK
ncbi:MAG TPA: CBS domain-containing protein [Nitrospiria bacterium]|nr:CBS domain-containing protein [Nitrospiria bacterium]